MHTQSAEPSAENPTKKGEHAFITVLLNLDAASFSDLPFSFPFLVFSPSLPHVDAAATSPEAEDDGLTPEQRKDIEQKRYEVRRARGGERQRRKKKKGKEQ